MARLENAAKAFLRINKPLLKMNIIKLSQVSRVAWRVSELRGKGTIIILLQKKQQQNTKNNPINVIGCCDCWCWHVFGRVKKGYCHPK